MGHLIGDLVTYHLGNRKYDGWTWPYFCDVHALRNVYVLYIGDILWNGDFINQEIEQIAALLGEIPIVLDIDKSTSSSFEYYGERISVDDEINEKEVENFLTSCQSKNVCLVKTHTHNKKPHARLYLNRLSLDTIAETTDTLIGHGPWTVYV